MEASRTERPEARWAAFAAIMILLANTFNG
jgi:hypothetical protein